MKCPKCQSENPDTQKFCGECGTSITSADEAQPPFTKTLEAPVEHLTRGTLFADRYEIIEPLGEGGMGTVYRVEDTKAREEIALKLIKPEISADRKIIERFRNELTTARRIRHKNICGMYDLAEDNGAYFITMEYVPGQDLRGLIRQTGKLTVESALSIAKQICEGLGAAHRLDVIHRDLKPSNIMIEKEGTVRIMDFGIARSRKTRGITGAGVMIGTPEYMSPEQAEAKDVDHRSDIYSLGIILYEMLTGRLPFEGETPLSIALKHKTEEFTSPKLLNPQVPGDLNDLILKCLAKTKADRYQTIEDVHRDIIEIIEKIPLTREASPKRRPLTSKEISVKLNAKKVVFLSIFIIILMAFGLYVLFRPGALQDNIEIGVMSQTTHDPGLELDPAISPDGKMVAFATGPVSRMHLVVRQISGGRSIAITQDFSGGQRWPRWSPDGNRKAGKNLRCPGGPLSELVSGRNQNCLCLGEREFCVQ